MIEYKETPAWYFMFGLFIGLVVGFLCNERPEIRRCESNPQWCEIEHPNLYKAINAKDPSNER